MVAALNPLKPDVDTIVDGIDAVRRTTSRRPGTGLAEATSIGYPHGRGAGAGAPMGRVIPVLTCHANRNPFPGPGEAADDDAPC